MANRLAFDSEALEQFKRKGYVKLKQIFTPEEIDLLRHWTQAPIWTSDDPQYGLAGFSNTTYRAGSRETIFERLAEDDGLRSTLRQLAGERLIYTNGNRFTLTPEHNGSPWHFGRMTFCFIEPLTLGYSLWVPLDPIDPADQHGGMAYVPEEVLSARGGFQLWAGYIQRVVSSPQREKLEAARRQQFGTEYGFPMLGPYDREFLDLVAESDSFDVGDAFFFSKFVWHRTEPLRPGAMPQRTACVLRYISEDARFAPDLMYAATQGMDDQERQANGVFGSYLTDLKKGDPIRTSQYCLPPR